MNQDRAKQELIASLLEHVDVAFDNFMDLEPNRISSELRYEMQDEIEAYIEKIVEDFWR